MKAHLTNGEAIAFNERECQLLARLLAAVADGRGNDDPVRDAARAAWGLVAERVAVTAGVSKPQHDPTSRLNRISAAVGPRGGAGAQCDAV